MNTQDEKVLKLQEAIAKKEKELEKIINPEYKTNLVISGLLDSQVFNLNVCNENTLILLAGTIQSLITSTGELGLTLKLNSYSLEDCLHDILLKIKIKNISVERNKLKMLKAELENMLSEEARTNMRLAELEKELGL